MRYSLRLAIESDKHLFEVLKADASITNDRSRTEIKEEKDKIICLIEASDPVALKAAINSVIKTLEVYGKLGD